MVFSRDMALPQQKFREIVFQLLYSHDLAQADDEDMIAMMMPQLEVTKKNLLEALSRRKEIQEKLHELDQLIAQTSESYEFERIPGIERNILRLGVFELLFSQIPHKVAIAEAIRLTRKFATPEAATFVNAILDKLYQTRVLSDAATV